MKDLIGKYYELHHSDGELINRIKINFVKERNIPEELFNDGSYYIGGKQILVSENGSGWYGIRNSKFEKIVDNVSRFSV